MAGRPPGGKASTGGTHTIPAHVSVTGSTLFFASITIWPFSPPASRTKIAAYWRTPSAIAPPFAW